MASQTSIRLTTGIGDIPGVEPSRISGFMHLGIRCVADLILHIPSRYEHELGEQSVEDASTQIPASGDANISVRGELVSVRMARGRKVRIECQLDDGTAAVKLTWFNAPWLRQRLHPGMYIRAWGRATQRGRTVQMINPRWEVVAEEGGPPARKERLRPVYRASEQIGSEMIERAVGSVLDDVLPQLEDHLHDAYRQQVAMPTLADAYRMVHQPADMDETRQGRRRLAYDELLLLQLGVMLKRHHRQRTLHTTALKRTDAIDQHIKSRFPFPLTESQEHVINEISRDLALDTPMNRLLQGDVGSGKTVVALYAMLLAVAAGHQATLMAPTELLAEQHYASIRSMLKGASVGIQRLTGSMTASRRREIEAFAASGEVDIVIGTHALLTESVEFKSLAVAVIDEQHRFGVHQRAMIRAKASDPQSCPHTLVMTATPIPRTLSLTIFGDLDVSTITGMPPGRMPVITRHVIPSRRDEVYAYAAERIAAGEQTYVVVPVIDESTNGLTDVESHLQWLREGPLAGYELAAMHGRLAAEERDEIMTRFRAGEIKALVATTVIEVGVDVAAATVMIIEHADRFGLAQLHQLRGRVGRGGARGLCALIAEPITPDGQARLEAITGTTNGFEIAEKDLEIRGPGELFGARQSGLAPFRVAQLPRDMELLRMARRDAEAWIEEDPRLSNPRDALLKRRLLKAHGDALGLGDVG